MSLINTLTVGITLNVVDADGKKDSVNIQPKGRIDLPAGYSVDPQYAREYQTYVMGIPPVASTPTPAPSRTPTPAPAPTPTTA